MDMPETIDFAIVLVWVCAEGEAFNRWAKTRLRRAEASRLFIVRHINGRGGQKANASLRLRDVYRHIKVTFPQ